jgi:hypothetical protein
MREQGCPTRRTVDCPYAPKAGAKSAASDRAMSRQTTSSSPDTAGSDCGCVPGAGSPEKYNATDKGLGLCGMNDLPFMPAEAATDVRTPK